ncbi:energy transducer TonB [bacterium]|nr:energy transducer TonB [bacterium]
MTEARTMTPALSGSPETDRRIIRTALVLSVLLHVVLVLGLREVDFTPDPEELARLREGREVEVYLEPDPETAADEKDSTLPDTYASVPDRHAQPEAPDDPQYLALHHSVAADNKLGDGDTPSADAEGEFNQVEIRREDLAGAAGVQVTTPPVPEQAPATSRQQAGAPDGDATAAEGETQPPGGEWAIPEETQQAGGESAGNGKDAETVDQPELEEWWNGARNPSILKEGSEGASGDRGFDFDQKAMGATTSGVAIVDDFQLSTVAWDWAPWIQVFGNELHRHWVPPYAYRLGLINGQTVIHLVVERDGRPSKMEILDQTGHQSLHDASLAALKAFAPYLPLPDHFPDKNLEITLILHYPAFRR